MAGQDYPGDLYELTNAGSTSAETNRQSYRMTSFLGRANITTQTDIISVSAIVPTEVHVWQEKTVGEVSGRFPEHGDS